MTAPLAVHSIAPILIVDQIEPCLPFWESLLNFAIVARVPETGTLDFAMLVSGPVQVMLQTRASAEADLAGVTRNVATAVLYLSVGSLDPILANIDHLDVAVPRRQTFYGADEIYVHDPAGNLVGFAVHTQ
jgi:hypothetical protein